MGTELTFSQALTNSLIETKDALPKDFNMTRFVQNSIALLNENTTLQNYAKEYGTAQIKVGMLRAAYLGLDFMSKEAYLIPYKSQLNFMLDYRGSVKLCKKYSMRPIKDIYAKVVREDDFFEEEIIHGEATINFKPKAFNNKPIIGAFAVCLFADGGMLYDVMNLEEIEMARSKSKAGNTMAWKDFRAEMVKKTVLHRLCKHIEIDFETPQQRQFFDDDMSIETEPINQVKNKVANEQATVDFIDAEATEVNV